MNLKPEELEFLISTQDSLELLRLLRTHPNPDVRSQVAARLPELDAVEIVEGLIRAYKLDSDAEVKRSARAALWKILGSTAADAISAYGDISEDENEFEKALLETKEFDPASVENDEQDYAPQVKNALDNQDALELKNILVSSASADLRAQAAEALGEIKNDSAVEFLIRAIKADPDEFVRDVAAQSLSNFMDPNTATAAVAAYGAFDIQEYQSNLTVQPTPLDSEKTRLEDGEIEIDSNVPIGSESWPVEQAAVLISILSDDRHPERQIKAINILAQHPSLGGNDAVSMAALWSDNAIVRQHAMKILESVYGEELQAHLAEYTHSRTPEDYLDDDEAMEDDQSEDQIEENVDSADYSQSISSADQPSTHQQESSFNGLQLILFILLIIILILIAQRFLLH